MGLYPVARELLGRLILNSATYLLRSPENRHRAGKMPEIIMIRYLSCATHLMAIRPVMIL